MNCANVLFCTDQIFVNMLEMLILKRLIQYTSQPVKRTSGTRQGSKSNVWFTKAHAFSIQATPLLMRTQSSRITTTMRRACSCDVSSQVQRCDLNKSISYAQQRVKEKATKTVWTDWTKMWTNVQTRLRCLEADNVCLQVSTRSLHLQKNKLPHDTMNTLSSAWLSFSPVKLSPKADSDVLSPTADPDLKHQRS